MVIKYTRQKPSKRQMIFILSKVTELIYKAIRSVLFKHNRKHKRFVYTLYLTKYSPALPTTGLLTF